jgi:hypothetical protein
VSGLRTLATPPPASAPPAGDQIVREGEACAGVDHVAAETGVFAAARGGAVGDVKAGDRHRLVFDRFLDVEDSMDRGLLDRDEPRPRTLDVDGVGDDDAVAGEGDRPRQPRGEGDRVGTRVGVGRRHLAPQAAVAGDAGVAEVGDRVGLGIGERRE